MSEFFQDSPHSAIPPKEFNEMKLKKKKKGAVLKTLRETSTLQTGCKAIGNLDFRTHAKFIQTRRSQTYM